MFKPKISQEVWQSFKPKYFWHLQKLRLYYLALPMRALNSSTYSSISVDELFTREKYFTQRTALFNLACDIKCRHVFRKNCLSLCVKNGF